MARRVRIVALVLVVGVLAAVVAWFLKPWYSAEARLLPPIEGGDVMSNIAGAIESSALSQVGLSDAFLYLRRFSDLSAGQQYRAMLADLVDR